MEDPLDSHSWRAGRRFRPIYIASPRVPPCWGCHNDAHRLDSEASWRRQGESSAVFDSVGVKFFPWVVFAVGRELSKFPTGEDTKRVSPGEIAFLRNDLEAKNREVETLERRFDKFTAQLTEFGKDTEKTLHALQEKVKERESQMASLQNHHNEKTGKAAMKNQLAQLRAEGNRIIDKALTTPTSRPPADERKQWFTNTIQYLRQNMDAGHVEEFRNPPASVLHFKGLPASHDVFASDVEARVKVLQRFTDELHETNRTQ